MGGRSKREEQEGKRRRQIGFAIGGSSSATHKGGSIPTRFRRVLVENAIAAKVEFQHQRE